MTALNPSVSLYQKASEINVGVVGYGHSGRRLNEMRTAGMTPRAVVEVDPARLAVAASDFPGIETYGSVGEMLKRSDVDLLTIVTPHNMHAPLAMQCLKAGRHVVCEKPLALTTRECDALIAAARKHGVLLSAYHNRHWDGCILRAIEQVKRKKVIGDVFRVDARMGSYGKPPDEWRTSRRISGGILYDWGVHLLEFILQLVDSEMTEVTGFAHAGFWAPHTRWKEDTNEDEAHLTVRFKNGARASLTVTQLDANPKPGFLEVTGTHGSYVIDAHGYTLVRCENGKRLTETGPHDESQFFRYFENIAAHLTRGTPLVITPEWARRPVHILDLAIQSAKEGRTLRAKYG